MRVLKSIKTKLNNTVELVGESGENNVLIIGVFHGDEPQGKYLIDEYLNTVFAPSPSRGDGMPRKTYTKVILSNAKKLRKNRTDAEYILWEYLRGNRFYNLKFKRQQPIGKYIVDFVCLEYKLIIELDGNQHFDKKKLNDVRTSYLNNCGYRVIRIWNNEVFNNIDGVLEYIYSSLLNNKDSLEDSLPFQGSGGKVSTNNADDFESHISYGNKNVNDRGNSAFVNLSNNKDCLEDSLPPRGGGAGRGGKRKNNLLFIPCLNPDGMSLNTRTNANGVDLNRNFPTKNWGKNEGENATCDDKSTGYWGGDSPAGECETQFVIDIINSFCPKIVLTLHAPYKVVNYDGPCEHIATQISQIINYPVESSIGYPTPGSFGTYCGVERNIPVITLELDEECDWHTLIEPMFKVFDTLSYL